jgi:hypothetical protein
MEIIESIAPFLSLELKLNNDIFLVLSRLSYSRAEIQSLTIVNSSPRQSLHFKNQRIQKYYGRKRREKKKKRRGPKDTFHCVLFYHNFLRVFYVYNFPVLKSINLKEEKKIRIVVPQYVCISIYNNIDHNENEEGGEREGEKFVNFFLYCIRIRSTLETTFFY